MLRRNTKFPKGKFFGSTCSFSYDTDYFTEKRIYSDEIPLPGYEFFTNRSSYFLEKKDYLASFTSTMWHGKAIELLKKII